MPDTVIMPTPEEIDALVLKLEDAVKRQELTADQIAAGLEAVELRSRLLTLTLAFGEVPKKAPASKRLLGETAVLTAIGGTTTTNHPDVVLKLRDAMLKAGHDELFASLYTPSTSYSRAKDAATTLRVAKLTKKERTLFSGLFEQAQTSAPRAPQLKVGRAEAA